MLISNPIFKFSILFLGDQRKCTNYSNLQNKQISKNGIKRVERIKTSFKKREHGCKINEMEKYMHWS